MTSIFERLFGGGVSSEQREAILTYFTKEWKLQSIQDSAGEQYNDVLTKYGGSLTPDSVGMSEVILAARRQADVYASLSRRHGELSPVPDEAGGCYFGWQETYLRLEEWASAMVAAYESIEAGATPHAGRLQELQAAEQKAEQDSRKEEMKLLKRLRIGAEEARRLMEESSAAARAEEPD